MPNYRIIAVSYANTLPFIYGLINSDISKEIQLDLRNPSECAAGLISGNADIGLIPVAKVPQINNYQIISNYCIGAEKKVRSVVLISEVPLNEIKNIFLDYQSETSIVLAQVLAKEHWKLNVQFLPAKPGFEYCDIKGVNAAVIIGDRVFELEKQFKFVYDLAFEWYKFTQLPFVFACWVANKPIADDFKERFEKALSVGIYDLEKVVQWQNDCAKYSSIDLMDYYTNNLSFIFDGKKREAMDLFLKYVKAINK